MSPIAEYIVAIADLAEAEGRALRRGTIVLGWALALIGVAALFLVAGLGLWVWALFLFTDTLFPSWGAATVTGAAVLGIAGVIAWLAARKTR